MHFFAFIRLKNIAKTSPACYDEKKSVRKGGAAMPAVFDVTAFGALGDGAADDCAAIQAAIDACAKNGGGRVLLPGGAVFYSASLILKPNVELHLEQGAVLKATGMLAHYFRPCCRLNDQTDLPGGNPVTGKPAYAFLYGKGAHGCAITGSGTIDGNAGAFVQRKNKYYVTGDFYPRPTTIYLEQCDHITIRDITIANAPFWTLHPAGCEDVQIEHIRILNGLDTANSDGIDPDHCRNVRIHGCHIVCADDCICLKNTLGNEGYGPCENIVITDCTLTSTSAAVKIGTEGVSVFRNVIVKGCVISRSNRGISIQIRDCGDVENILFSDILIETRRFSPDWWGTGEPIAITAQNRFPGKPCGKIQNIRFHNIHAKGENGVLIHSHPENNITDITFENVSITLTKTSKWPCGYYDLRPGLASRIKEAPISAFYLRGCSRVALRDVQTRWGALCPAYRHAIDAKKVDGLHLKAFDGIGTNGAEPFLFTKVTNSKQTDPFQWNNREETK